MKKHKFFLVLTCAFALALTASAQVTTRTVGTFTGGTNNVAATTTNTLPAVIANAGVVIDNGAYISISTQFACTAANSGNAVFTYQPTDSSTNGSTLTGEKIVITIPCNGTTQVNSVTNVFIGGTPTLLLQSVGNTGASAITNLQLRVNYKRNI
jgi:hypothetical protein